MTPPAVMGLARPTVAATAEPDAARRGLALGLTLFALALPAFSLLEYALPPRTDAHYWGLNPEGMRQFAAHCGLGGLPTVSPDTFSLAFRLLLLALWSGYALSMLAVLQGAELRPRALLAGVIGAAAFLAVFSPPLLSHDVYAYAAQGRLAALYGQHPYRCPPFYLATVGDPAARYLTWNHPNAYGPLWVRLEIAIVALLRTGGLWPQVVALKLIEAGALVGLAVAGRRITARLSPGREDLTLLAIGLNPLLLLEGPGSGHNDLLLVCLLVVGAMFFLEKKYAAAAIFLGWSVGIKLITLAVIPWVVGEYGRGRPGRQKLAAWAVALAAVVLPLTLCLGGWGGGSVLAAMGQRSLYHLSPEALAQNDQVHAWLLAHDVGAPLAAFGVLLFQNRVVLALFAGLSAWLCRQRQGGAWLTAWAVLAAGLMFFSLGQPFPWYVAWFWPVCLLRWDRLHLTLSGLCFGLSLTWEAGYGILDQ